MKTYKTSKKANGNRIVEELNANVLTATFTSKEGKQKADVYKSENTQIREIVAIGTCAPVNMIFQETVFITF